MIKSSTIQPKARRSFAGETREASPATEASSNAPSNSLKIRTDFDPLEMEASFEGSTGPSSEDNFLRLGSLRNGNASFLQTQPIGSSEPQPNPSVFDEEFYLTTNPDVAQAVAGGAFASGLEHYQRHGGGEGRDPNGSFDEDFYLQNNPDVAAAVEGGAFASGFDHFVRHGAGENRLPTADFEPTAPIAQASPTGPSSTDPSQRRDFIEDQLAQHNELETLSTNVSDDPQSFQALLDILNEDFNVVIRDLGERGNGPFSTTDLLNVANQLNNLPEHIIDSYIEAGQEIVVANGDFTLTQEFQDAHPPGLFERNEQGQVLGADGTPVSGDGGTHAYGSASGTGVTFVTLDALREDANGNAGAQLVDGSDSTLLHELAHGLDNVGGNDNEFQEISHSAEFTQLVNRPEVWSYLETIQNGDFHSNPENVEEHFAELFANYYASTETRSAIPASAQEFFANLALQA